MGLLQSMLSSAEEKSSVLMTCSVCSLEAGVNSGFAGVYYPSDLKLTLSYIGNV